MGTWAQGAGVPRSHQMIDDHAGARGQTLVPFMGRGLAFSGLGSSGLPEILSGWLNPRTRACNDKEASDGKLLGKVSGHGLA